ncbi:hypothetical protein V2J09_001688, partial [Rumex salicifolius]
AWYYEEYGPKEVLRVGDFPLPPSPNQNQLLVQVHAAAVNPIDCKRRQSPIFPSELPQRAKSHKIQPRRRGVRQLGTLAEFILLEEALVALKPSNLSFEEAAALPLAFQTAVEGFATGGFRRGQSVFVVGGAGGCGSLVVQLAKYVYGASMVVASCSTPEVEFVKSLGADYVVDYLKITYEQVEDKFDFLYDTIAKDEAPIIDITWPPSHPRATYSSLTVSGEVLESLRPYLEYLEAGKLNPIINPSSPYAFSDVMEAFRHLETGRAQGKVVISSFPCSYQLWHRRFGHLSHQGLKKLEQQSMVKGLPTIKGEATEIVDDSESEREETTTDAGTEIVLPSGSDGNAASLEIDEAPATESVQQDMSAAEHGVAHSENVACPDVEVSESIQDSGILRQRVRTRPSWFEDYEVGNIVHYSLQMDSEDPIYFEDVVRSKKWRNAMTKEMESIKKNDTWELTSLPQGVVPIGVKWVYKTKLNEHGEVDKYKARLVAKGYSQKHGIDYSEVFAPVARWDTIRSILALAAHRDWKVYQLDVKSAFLHGELTEQVFVTQPPGYVRSGEENKVYRLKKALYGLKQAPRAWYSRIEKYFVEAEFQRCPYEHTLFILQKDDDVLLVSLYVDDVMYTSSNEKLIREFKENMQAVFEMTDLGKMRFFLGVEVNQTANGVFICQKKYTREMLLTFGLLECNFVRNPIVPGEKLTLAGDGVLVDSTQYKQLIGSLLYLTNTRPDVMFVVGLLSRYMARPTRLHLQAAKRVLRYLKGTMEFGIWYRKGLKNGRLIGYTDSDHAGDKDDRKSTSGYVFFLAGGAVSWSSKKQPVVALSSTETEFVAAASCAAQCIWLRRILEAMSWWENVQGATTIYCDNVSTIKLSKNPVLHGRSKHIDLRFHFLRDLVNDGIVEMEHCGTESQVADILTKAVKLDTFEYLRGRLGVEEWSSTAGSAKSD